MFIALLIGIVIGMLISVSVFVLVNLYKTPLLQEVYRAERKLQAVNAPKGFIVEPDTWADERRQEIIERNKAEGKDTKLSDLI